jgi:hypothetical protein
LKQDNRFFNTILVFLFVMIFLIPCHQLLGQTEEKDTLDNGKQEKYEIFYDSLQSKARQRSLTNLLYNLLISNRSANPDTTAFGYYAKMEGKIISEIQILTLEAFGPTFSDTARRAISWFEKTANAVHFSTSDNTIRKMLLFEEGDFVDPEVMYENERIIRSLRYIQDVWFILEQDSVYQGLVKVHVITKDRFPVGITGAVNGGQSAALELYNQNIFGVGHEISLRFVGHLNRQPYTGLETFYKINNISGRFIDIAAGYMNTYRTEGFSLIIDKSFITPSIKWGYGGSALRMYRTLRIYEDHPVQTAEPMDLSFFSAWGARSIQLRPNHLQNFQMVLSGAIYNNTFYKRPDPSSENNQYFSNKTFYMMGLSFSQRYYKQDQLVYSYGITEDIPEGFKNEIVYGYDINEFGNRHYAHLFLSNGNLMVKRPGYLYLSAGIGGFLKDMEYEQGQIQFGMNYISRQINAGRKRFRLFLRSNYIIGIRRFEIEDLYLNKEDHIRGFLSRQVTGKQRLSFNMEYVLFLHQEFYKFNMAAYGFTDIGIIGSNKQPVFAGKYYSGLGVGMRLHNENLVFKTVQLRLAFYPFAPSDMNFTGFLVEEQLKKDFYNFRPTQPMPLRFE